MTEDGHAPPRPQVLPKAVCNIPMPPVEPTLGPRPDVVTVLRTDAFIAQELRDELAPLLDQVCIVMTKAKASGMQLAWSIQPDSFGRRFRVVEISIVKPL